MRFKRASSAPGDFGGRSWARIESVEAGVGAFLHRMPESAVRQAEEAGERPKRARREGRSTKPPLLGVSVGVKDNFRRGERPRRAARGCWRIRPAYDATVVAG